LLDEQRTVDVPYGSDALWADIGEPALCSSAGHASAKSTSGTCSSGGSVKGTAAKRCKLYESQQHNKYYVDHSLKVDGFSAAAEKAAAVLNH
jgi:hypothetical protein